MTLKDSKKRKTRGLPDLISRAMQDADSTGNGLVFRPEPPGDQGRLDLPIVTIDIDVETDELETLFEGLGSGALSKDDVLAVLKATKSDYGVVCPKSLEAKLVEACKPADIQDPFSDMSVNHHLERIALISVKIIDRAQNALLQTAPLTEVRYQFSPPAKIALRLSWEAMAKHGRFPLPPKGPQRLNRLQEKPCGSMHFVSASDGDAGFIYTMGIALSPEAQALQNMDVSYGLDGELIVPGQAVSPIPPTLALATRLFAASIPTSSNISEDIHAIPYSSFAHPDTLDVAPLRGDMFFRPQRVSHGNSVEDAKAILRDMLDSYEDFLRRTTAAERDFLPDVGGAIDISRIHDDEVVPFVESVIEDFSETERSRTSLFLILWSSKGDDAATAYEFAETPRYKKTCSIIDAAQQTGLKYVSICNEEEDQWMPHLLEYFTASEVNALADYADQRGVILCDGRPVDPVYAASTAAQRIQSVFSTLSVDILKMGMWLCLDALSARRVWRELVDNPHIPERMFLMPIGIVEPYSAFLDNRDKTKSPRAIINPFEKIKFMIEEADFLGAPSLLTDTRHKSRWVLLGAADGDLEPHLRENKEYGATSLIGREKFMECERLAREAGILLGQAGSIETDQIFWIISDTTFDAAKVKSNPATAFWTAETERVLRRADGSSLAGDLQSQRRANVMPYLAVTNRAFESHAKVDGWLRYLESLGQDKTTLRQSLLDQKERCEVLQENVVQAMDNLGDTPDDDPPEARKAYTKAWDEFSSAFSEYHMAIRENFQTVRDQVAAAWAAS
jgi:hypothetical protein